MNIQMIPGIMSDFNALCKKFENSDPAALKDIMTRKLKSVYDALMALPEKEGAVTTFSHFMLCTMVSDGVFQREAFDLLQSKMDLDILTDMDFEEMRDYTIEQKLIDPEVSESIIASMIGIMGRLSEFVKDDIILIAFMVCGIDGDVTEKEKALISRLMV